MSKKTKGGYYAVNKGRVTGVFTNWPECEAQVKGFVGAKYKKFPSEAEAQRFAYPDMAESSQSIVPGPSSTPSKKAPNTASTSSSTADGKGKKRAFGPEVSNTDGWNIVYSDGACKGNGKRNPVAGVGVYWGPGDPRNIYERCPGGQTNNRAELIAILRVLETIPAEDKTPLLIRTDSQYSIQCFREWVSVWKRKEWINAAGEPVKNAGVIKCISTLLDIHGRLGQKVVLEYVKGHSNDAGNDGADLMANRGATLPEVPDRDWDALYSELMDRLQQIGNRRQIPFEVKVSDAPPPASVGPALKVRKLDTGAKPVTVAEGSHKQASLPAQSGIGGSSAPKKASNIVPASLFAALCPPVPSRSNQPLPNSQPNSQKSTSSSYDRIWNEHNKTPLQAIYITPSTPSALDSVDASGINFEDYADCLLDSSDLANDLID